MSVFNLDEYFRTHVSELKVSARERKKLGKLSISPFKGLCNSYDSFRNLPTEAPYASNQEMFIPELEPKISEI